MNYEGHDCGSQADTAHRSAADRWIVSRLQKTEAAATQIGRASCRERV